MVRHAMLFTLLVGERYLWVDTLCNVQDDLQSKHEKIERMDEIYMRGLVTFVSLGPGDEGRPWLGEGPPKHIPLIMDANLGYDELEKTTAMGKTLWKLKKQTSQMKKVHILIHPPLTPEHIPPFHNLRKPRVERLLSTRIVYFSRWQMYAQ